MIQIRFNVDRNFANIIGTRGHVVINTDADGVTKLADEIDRCDGIDVEEIMVNSNGTHRIVCKLEDSEDVVAAVCECITTVYGGSIVIRRIRS